MMSIVLSGSRSVSVVVYFSHWFSYVLVGSQCSCRFSVVLVGSQCCRRFSMVLSGSRRFSKFLSAFCWFS